MISLLYKELLVQKRVLGMAFLYIFVFSFAMKNLGEQLPLAIITAVSYMFVLYGGAWDEKASSDRLWNSLPVPKWKIVGARYLALLVYTVLVAPLTTAVLALLTSAGIIKAAGAASLVNALAGVGAVMVLASLFLPLYFAFGYTKSRVLNMLVFVGSFSLSTIVSSSVSKQPAWIAALDRLGGAVVAVGAVGLVAVIAVLSFFVSLKLYSRREF
jgi:ABC-2 type transport system permease protein